MENKFFEFTQNNSGGHFDVDDKVCHRVVIEAADEVEALRILEPMIENQSGSCPCCGDRWSSYSSEIDVTKFNNDGWIVSVYDHYPKPEVLWNKKYGKYEIFEKPTWKTKYGSKIFEGKILFRSIEEYMQFLANEYGWTTPDVRIYYKNGEVKEFFTQELE